MITKIIQLLFYYILLFTGLFMTSWIMWSRFIRKRTIKNIPDELFSEYRFWILLYICCIYIYIIKNLIKESKSDILPSQITKSLIDFIWKPLTILDHAIKYNKYTKNRYYSLVRWFIDYTDQQTNNWHRFIILSFHVIPRVILVVFLLADTFYFHKLEIFYKIILIGLLPLTFRYIEYSLKDIYHHWIEELSKEYNKVIIFEKGFEHDISRKSETEAIFHFEIITIEEYIEIMFDTDIDRLGEIINYEYTGYAFCTTETYKSYEKKFKKPIESWSTEDIEEVQTLFKESTAELISLKFTLENLRMLKKERKIRWPKIIIFSLYLLCWGYILIISYYNYPVELVMFKNVVQYIMEHFIKTEDPFTGIIYNINDYLSFLCSL